MTGWIGLYESLNAMRELVMAGDGGGVWNAWRSGHVRQDTSLSESVQLAHSIVTDSVSGRRNAIGYVRSLVRPSVCILHREAEKKEPIFFCVHLFCTWQKLVIFSYRPLH